MFTPGSFARRALASDAMPIVDTNTLEPREPKPDWHGRFFRSETVPPNAPHAARAITDCRAIVVDQGIREEIGGVSTAAG